MTAWQGTPNDPHDSHLHDALAYVAPVGNALVGVSGAGVTRATPCVEVFWDHATLTLWGEWRSYHLLTGQGLGYRHALLEERQLYDMPVLDTRVTAERLEHIVSAWCDQAMVEYVKLVCDTIDADTLDMLWPREARNRTMQDLISKMVKCTLPHLTRNQR